MIGAGVPSGDGEVGGEPGGVDRGGRDDHLEVGPPWQELLEIAEQEVDVEAALVGLVDDDRVVATQLAITLELGQQDPVGHHPDEGLVTDVVLEPDRVADRFAQLHVELLGEPLGDRAGRHPAGLGVADQPVDATPELQTQLGELGALARAGLARHHDDLMVGDRLAQVVGALGDRQLGRQPDRPQLGERAPAPLDGVGGRSRCGPAGHGPPG